MSEKVGEIYYVIEAETAALLTGARLAEKAMDDLDSSAKSASKGVDALEKKAKSAGLSLDKLEGYSQSMDSSLKTLNTSMSAVATAITQANSSSDAAAQGFTNMNATLNGLMAAVKSVAVSMQEVSTATKSTASEFSRSESIIEGLGNQIAILEEAQQASARSAAILAAQLRAGSNATDEEKAKIADLTGRLYDMKTASDQGGKSHGNWKGQMQQAGYQVQDFIVQVQGGQSALVAFSQQGSQLAGAFGPGGAVVGAFIALSTVLAGTLITALNGGKSAMDAMKDAAASMDNVITVSQSGVAALSNQYANLARTNTQLATIMRTQVLLEYNQAMSKVGKAISETSSDFFSFGDIAQASLSGGSASVKLFSATLDAAGIKTNSFNEAFEQLSKSSINNQATMSTFLNTLGALASRFGISDQAAFELAKQLSDLSKNPSPQALQDLAVKLQSMTSSTKDGQQAITELLGPIVALSREAANAALNVDQLKKTTDNLTDGQKNLITQSERTLELSKKVGDERARLQAQYAAEDAGLDKSDPRVKQMEDQAAAAYKNTEANKKLKSEQQKGATQAENIAQKLANLKQQSELAADSTNKLSREQAILNAQQSLGKGATQAQIQLAGQYAAKKWDTANAIKAQAAAEKLLPEARENASYKQDVESLNTALTAKKISQQQYNQISEQLEQQHQANLAKIRADQAAGVSPLQDSQGAIDPVQQLANENARKLALIQQFETEKGKLTANGLMLQNAANTEYEQARMDAAWKIYEAQSQANQMLGDVVDSLQGGATSAITGLINGTQSLEESLANIGSTIINSVVSGLVEMGLQYVKNMIIGEAAAAAALASTTAQAAAATAAWAPAAVSASIATLGSASAVGTTAYTTAIAASKGLAIAGAREHGGPVNANSMYRVGEGGKPEIFKASNGSQYMIPGDNGSVISNKDIGGAGGGGGIQQEVHFHIQTTNGIDDATMQKMAGMMKQVALYQMKDQTRPGGMLGPRK